MCRAWRQEASNVHTSPGGKLGGQSTGGPRQPVRCPSTLGHLHSVPSEEVRPQDSWGPFIPARGTPPFSRSVGYMNQGMRWGNWKRMPSYGRDSAGSGSGWTVGSVSEPVGWVGAQGSHLARFHTVGQHDEGATLLLPHQAPEVTHRLGQGTLGCDELLGVLETLVEGNRLQSLPSRRHPGPAPSWLRTTTLQA